MGCIMFVPSTIWLECGMSGVRITRRFRSVNHFTRDPLARLPVWGVLPVDVCQTIQRWWPCVRNRCKPPVPKVVGLTLFLVFGRGLFDYNRPAWSVFLSGVYQPLQSLWLSIRIRCIPRFRKVERTNGSYCCRVRPEVCGVLPFDGPRLLANR